MGEEGIWGSTGVIKTPSGNYTPESDDLGAELQKAARQASLAEFKVYINGIQIPSASQLPTNSIAALAHQASIEGVTPSAEVKPYDTAA